MANDAFSEPPRRADSKKRIFIWPVFGSRSPPGPGGSVSVGFWGPHQLSPFWGEGGSSHGALSTPPPSNGKPACPRVAIPFHPWKEAGMDSNPLLLIFSHLMRMVGHVVCQTLGIQKPLGRTGS